MMTCPIVFTYRWRSNLWFLSQYLAIHCNCSVLRHRIARFLWRAYWGHRHCISPPRVPTGGLRVPENTLQWRHNWHDSVSNHQPHDCLLNRLFRRRSKKTYMLRVNGLCAENSPGTGEFSAQMTSNAEMFPFDDVIMRPPRNNTMTL